MDTVECFFSQKYINDSELNFDHLHFGTFYN